LQAQTLWTRESFGLTLTLRRYMEAKTGTNMSLKRKETPLSGLVVVEQVQYRDNRGYFWEVFNSDTWKAVGFDLNFVQVNQSGSMKNVVRGLHFQFDPPMGKLMRVARGKAFLVAVDIRIDSPTLGRWYGIEADEDNKVQVWGEAGFARGFCALSDYAEVQYLCTANYSAKGESGFKWNDEEIGVKWPVERPIVSDKDDQAQTFREWLARPEAHLFKIQGH
jgi:dTDP-4-dehydrorhamnose 3,5-epimerase